MDAASFSVHPSYISIALAHKCSKVIHTINARLGIHNCEFSIVWMKIVPVSIKLLAERI
jgi:hypothetical protein